jgi:hypothetical protein
MDVKRFSFIGFLIVIGALFLLSSPIEGRNYCSAALVWTDNFNDGDFSDWTVESGTFSVADGSLRGSDSANAIRHDSSTAQGTWTFDIELVSTSSVYVSFLAGETSGGIATSCYCLRITEADMRLLESTNYQNTLLDRYNPVESIAGWQHIDITRDASGEFLIYVNDTLQLEASDTNHGTSNYFVFYCNPGCAIDNIVISDSVDIEPPTTPTTPTTPTSDTESASPPGIPGFPFAAITLGLLIPLLLVLFMRHRSPPRQK